MQQGVEQGRASGQEGTALWGWQLAVPSSASVPQTDPRTRHAAWPQEGAGTVCSSRAVGGRCAGAGGAQPSVFPDPKLSSPPLPAPPYPLPFSRKYCSHNFRKLKGKNKGSHELLPSSTICLEALNLPGRN